ncbi:MRNIP protein, partial [Sapayoa aenigma]|nr:MRNIP protein [Sapayoa aenigma]
RSLVPVRPPQVYGQGSGPDCRRHVQKLNLLQGEAEEALGWTSWCVEDSVNDNKNGAAQHGDSSDQQGSQTSEASRWSKYLDQESEDQEDGEEEAALERQQFCSQRKNIVGEQRKHQKSFLFSDVPEHAAENRVFQLDYQAKKHKKCFGAVPDGDAGHDRDAVSGGSVVAAASQSVVPEDKTRPSTACAKPSKWGKFLSSSDNSSGDAARVALSLQQDSGGLGLDSTTAADAGMARRCSEQVGKTLPQHTGFVFKKCVTSTEGLGLKLPGTVVPSTSYPVQDVFKEPPRQLVRAESGAETTAGRCCLDSTSRANRINSIPGPKLSNISREQLFCTGEEFDDDL